MMETIFNKKMGVVVLSTILLLALIVPSIDTAIAQGGPPGGPPGQGGGGGGQGTTIDCDIDNPIEPGVTDGDVRVKDGKTCIISSMTGEIEINGDVIAGDGSMLQIYTYDDVGLTYSLTINGDVKTNGGLRIMIMGSAGNHVTITGDVQIMNTSEGISVQYVNIGGSAQFNSNLQTYSITNSNVVGSVQVKDNATTEESDLTDHEFSGNDVGKNLQCSGNDAAPVAVNFGLNDVAGKAQGQCSGLANP